jgi:tetratricopeptide (TPR) repeat protein
MELDPMNPEPHWRLGHLLDKQGRLDEAIASFRRMVELDPGQAHAHASLGIALANKGRLDEAITSYRRAIALDPKLGLGHGGLGEALLDKGLYAEARTANVRALQLLPEKDPNWTEVSRNLQTCERLAKLEGRLPGLLKREEKAATAQESLDVFLMCRHKQLHAAAARFAAAAYAADPKLGDNLKSGERYRAARSAALAAGGQGEDAAKLDDKERTRLRTQALDWLRADLALRTKQLEGGQPADRAEVQRLVLWQQESELAAIRDAAALANLPAEERTALTQLWADVAALLHKADEKPVPFDEDKLAALYSRAEEHLRSGKPDLALPLLVEVLNSKAANLGPDDPDTLATMNQLGVVYWKMGQLDKSVPLFEKLVKIQEAILGRDQPATMASVANLGVNYRDAGKLKEAITLLEEAHRAAKKDPNLGWVVNQLIEAYSKAGEKAKAADMLLEQLPAARKTLPKDSPQLAGMLAQIGLGLLEQKKWAEAEPLLRECLAIREKQEPDDWRTFNTNSILGGALLGQKKYADAEALLISGYEGMKKREKTIPPQGMPRLPEAIDRLIELYTAINKADEAKQWRAERAKHPSVAPPMREKP